MKGERFIEETVILYMPTGPDEVGLVRQSGFTKWPPRLPGQPIFYPLTNEEYAREIAIRWNARDGKTGYVTRFNVKKSFMKRYEIHQVVCGPEGHPPRILSKGGR